MKNNEYQTRLVVFVSRVIKRLRRSGAVISGSSVLALFLWTGWQLVQADTNTPTAAPSLDRKLAVSTNYLSEASLAQSPIDNQAQPLTLASADFDEDGMPDLVSGYATGSGGGILTIHRGNVHSLFPYGDALRDGKPAAFLPDAIVLGLPEPPDLLGVGDFNADGHWDIVAVKRGSNALYFLPNGGRGGFHAVERFELSGLATALTTGEINRADGLTDLIVGINGPDDPKALVFESPEGAVKATPEIFSLPAIATSFAVGQFAGDGCTDLAIAAGDNLIIIRGRDRKLSLDELQSQQVEPAVVTSKRLPFSITTIAVGNFSGEFEGELALLSGEGQVFMLTPPKTPVTKTELAPAPAAATMEGIPVTINATVPAPALLPDSGLNKRPPSRRLHGESRLQRFVPRTDGPIGEWLLSGPIGGAHLESMPATVNGLLISARVKSAANDDLLIAKGSDRQMRLVGIDTGKQERKDVIALPLEMEGEPIAVLPMRLNRDALSDLVILNRNSIEPEIVLTEAAATFIVTTADDHNDTNCTAADCTLREAINAANANAGADLITFNIPGSGVHTITITGTTGLPTLTDTVTIDGYTQPGSSPNTLANGDNSVLRIELSGTEAAAGYSGFFIDTTNCVIRGMVINQFKYLTQGNFVLGGFGIVFPDTGGATGNHFEGNYIGMDPSGTIAKPNTNGGVWIFGNTNHNNVFGGTAPAMRNLFSGSGSGSRAELNVTGAHNGTIVQGNFIGTDITGTKSISRSGFGVYFFNARNTLIGGTTAGARNIISGNGTGITFLAVGNPLHQVTGTLIQGNTFGLDVNGALLGNDDGIAYGYCSGTTVGGTTPAAANIISASINNGMYFFTGASGHIIQGNFIGADASGANKANLKDGINIGSSDSNTIGGVVAGAGNLIVFNGLHGIGTNTDQFAWRNRIRGNSIHDNGLLGIDLASNGVSANDACDVDTGPNTLQNYPVLTNVPAGTLLVAATATDSLGNTSEFSPCVRASVAGGNVVLLGTLDSTASTTFSLDFYSNATCDPSGNGEGQTYLGSTTVTTGSTCSGVVDVILPAPAPTPTPTPTPTPAPSCINNPGVARTLLDFDGDKCADIVVFRPSDSVWYGLLSFGNSFNAFKFGLSSDTLVPADYDGDGKTDYGIFRDGTWWIFQSLDSQVSAVKFGQAGDLPRPSDFDGDGKADLCIFRQTDGNWWRQNSLDGQVVGFHFGQTGDAPMIGDFDGDGKADNTVFRPSNGVWYTFRSIDSQVKIDQFGLTNDIPLNGDFNGDGKSDLAVYRPTDGRWYIARPIGVPAQNFDAIPFGISTDIPVPADYDGDGKTDIGIYRGGQWWIMRSNGGVVTVSQFGLISDKPVQSVYALAPAP